MELGSTVNKRRLRWWLRDRVLAEDPGSIPDIDKKFIYSSHLFSSSVSVTLTTGFLDPSVLLNSFLS